MLSAVPGKTRHTQIPVVLRFGLVGYADVAGISADLTNGFDMLGRAASWPCTQPHLTAAHRRATARLLTLERARR